MCAYWFFQWAFLFMAKSYPIWVNVTACIYKSSKSYGIRNTGEQTYHVGSSASNSVEFVRTRITKRTVTLNDAEYVIFRYTVDDVIIKQAVFTSTKKGTAGTLLRIETNAPFTNGSY